jgi:hypothetical protein
MSACTATAQAEPTAPPDDDGYISLAKAARVARLHETTLLRMTAAGLIQTKIRGRRTVYRAEDVRRALASA